MPEGLEVEIYRRAARATVGRAIASVVADDRCSGPGLHTLEGEVVDGTARVGKQLVIETSGPSLGLHFGMTGRLVVDDAAAIERLEYASGRDDPRWDRLTVAFDDGGVLRVNDPRRWSRAELAPDLSRLGPDMFDVTAEQIAAAFARRGVAVKAVLLDQQAVAGLGNLCVDEVLWHAGIAPTVPARDLASSDVHRLHRVMMEQLPSMLERGGSHTGTLDPTVRAELPGCPRDGAPLRRGTVAGRTTVWCPVHQVEVDAGA